MQAAVFSQTEVPSDVERTQRSFARFAQRKVVGWLDRATARIDADVPLLERILRRVEPTLSLRTVRARVVAKYAETHDVTTLVLRPNARFETYRPGAYVTLHLRIGEQRVERAYSISSAPGDDGRFAITFKRVPGGRVSNHLADHVSVGDVLTLSGPSGRFLLPEPRPPALLLISAGSGITPVMSMLRQLHAERADTKVVFLHFARTPEDLIFQRELGEIARSASNVQLVQCVESAGEGWTGERGRFCLELLERWAPNFRELDTFLCGPSPFMQAVIETLETHAADLAKLRYERFSTAFDASRFLKHAGEVRFVRSGREVITKQSRSLLEEAEALGVAIESSCRAGNCGTCRTRKLCGVVTDITTGRDSSPGEELIYPCVSIPRGVVELDL